jgi:hypothetical protein
MRKLTLSILFLLIIAGVPPAADAVQIQIKVNGVVVFTSAPVATPGNTATLCAAAPCTVTATTPIPAGTYGGVLNVLTGASATAKVTTNKTTIATSSSVTNSLNVIGTFKYTGALVPGSIVFTTSNEFALKSGAWTTNSTTSTTNQASICKKNTSGVYVAASCTLSSAKLNDGTCTLCRAPGFTEEGYVTKPDPEDPLVGSVPAGGAIVNMTSSMIFKKTDLTTGATEQVGSMLSYTIPPTLTFEDAHFYVGTSSSELVPCEPLKTTGGLAFSCASNETKEGVIAFLNLPAQATVFLPATSTDFTTSDPGILAILLNTHIPIDFQPLSDVAFNPDKYGVGVGGFEGGNNNDFNVGSSGTRQVVALSTPTIDACAFEPFDLTDPVNPIPLVFLSVAGSDPTATIASDPVLDLKDFDGDTFCDGRVFHFSIPDIVATIPTPNAVDPNNPTPEELRAACIANPSATLIVADVTQVSEYEITTATGKGGAKKATYSVPPECTTETVGGIKVVTCTVNAELGGSQIIKCSVPAGG